MRVRAAQRVPPQHLFGPQIAAIEELSLHLGDAVHAPDALSDAAPRPRDHLRTHHMTSNGGGGIPDPYSRPFRIPHSPPSASAAMTSPSLFPSPPPPTTGPPSPTPTPNPRGEPNTKA